MTFKIPYITWAGGHSVNLFAGLQGPGWLYVLGIPWGLATLNPQSTCPRPRPGPKRARGVLAGSLSATVSRARETTHGRERKKCRSAKKTRLYIVIQVSPLGCVWREFPGVRQVEKGHAGNTAVATAYLCWVKHGHRSSRTGVPADYY